MSQEPERSTQIHQAINLMIHTMRMHHRNVDRIFCDSAASRGQRMLLMRLGKSDRPMNQKELADRADISAACVARTLKNLASENLITRTGDANDQRRNNVELTEKGRMIVTETQQAFDLFDQTIFEGVSDEEVDQLITLLGKLQQNLHAYEDKHADRANLTEGSGSV